MSDYLTALTLLHNRRGKAPDYSTVKIQWNKAKKAAGVPAATLHDLRAVAATAARTERYLRDRGEVIAEGPSFRQST